MCQSNFIRHRIVFEAGKSLTELSKSMWPWGHLAAGYLLYSALARQRFDRSPDDRAALFVLFGTQFPDLVDKPLAWSFHLLPGGRSLGHSLLTAIVVCVLVGWYAHRHGYALSALGFAVGYVTHLVTDAIAPLLGGQYAYVAYLGWPLLDLPPYDTGIGFLERFASMEFTPLMGVEFVLVALALAVWLRDGRPGPAALRGWLSSWWRTAEHPNR